LARAKTPIAETQLSASVARRGGALGLRIASALVLGPLALILAWVGGPYFAALIVAAALGMSWEWARLSGAGGGATMLAVMATSLAASLAAAWGLAVPGLLVALIGAASVWGVAARADAAAPLWTAAGTAWLALPCVALLWLSRGEAGRFLVFWLFAVVWASDVGAYAAGRTLGGPRLAPRLSPNKTWSGALGGLACAGIAGAGATIIAGAPLLQTTLLSLVLSLAAQLGDLAESLAKRHFGAKDSGALIPGHGGLLDRLDSLLTATATLGVLVWAGLGPGFYPQP
jgi:phosphatidate cytidylyltransferase